VASASVAGVTASPAAGVADSTFASAAGAVASFSVEKAGHGDIPAISQNPKPAAHPV